MSRQQMAVKSSVRAKKNSLIVKEFHRYLYLYPNKDININRHTMFYMDLGNISFIIF